MKLQVDLFIVLLFRVLNSVRTMKSRTLRRSTCNLLMKKVDIFIRILQANFRLQVDLFIVLLFRVLNSVRTLKSRTLKRSTCNLLMKLRANS